MKHSVQLLFTLLLTCIFQVISAQKKDDAVIFTKVDSLLIHSYNDKKPGIALAIIEKGKTIYSNQKGLANMEYEIPITDSTAFHIASVSKQFTAYLAIKLEKEGLLSLDDDIKKYLPELKNLPFKISIRQLANHTHGLPNLFELAQLKGIRIQDRMTHKDVIKMLLNIRQINFKPGEKYEYNNTGFALLAEIIERVCKSPFQEVLKNRIFVPLNMNNSLAVNSSSLIIKNKAYSYKLNDKKYENYDFNIMVNGSSGISTTIDDLSKWANHFQNVNNVSDKEIFTEMMIPTVLNSGEIIQYGLGLEFKKYKGLDIVFHGGGDAGYRSYILHIPKYSFSVIILGNNNDFTPLEMVYKIVDIFLKDYEKTNIASQKIKYTTKELKIFEGTYEMFPGTYYNIIAESDSLFFQSFGQKDKLALPVIGDDNFLFPYIPTSKFHFYKNRFDFYIADFKYSCIKVNLIPQSTEKINLKSFAGIYHNEEFNTEYELLIEDDQLIARHSLNGDIPLFPLEKDSFRSNESFFGKLDFNKNNKDEFYEFQVSGQNLKNIVFTKIK